MSFSVFGKLCHHHYNQICNIFITPPPKKATYSLAVITHFLTIPLLLMLLSHFSRVRLRATPQTAACQAPPSMGLSRQEYWSQLPCPPLGNLPKPEIKQVFCTAGRFFTTEPPGKPHNSSPRWTIIYLLYLPIPNTSFWRRQWHSTPVLLPGESHAFFFKNNIYSSNKHFFVTILKAFTK